MKPARAPRPLQIVKSATAVFRARVLQGRGPRARATARSRSRGAGTRDLRRPRGGLGVDQMPPASSPSTCADAARPPGLKLDFHAAPLDMPARPPRAPGRRPRDFPIFSSLPQSKIALISFVVRRRRRVLLDQRRGLRRRRRRAPPFREGAVGCAKFRNIKPDAAIRRRIPITLLYDLRVNWTMSSMCSETLNTKVGSLHTRVSPSLRKNWPPRLSLVPKAPCLAPPPF